MNRTKNLNFSVLRLLFVSIFCAFTFSLFAQRTTVWTNEQANQWYKQWGWLRGCNFIPSTAINQLEMWQAETFDEATIDRELGWAEGIGMNCMRVYLHHLAWETDKKGFKKRMGKYLKIADKHHIATIFVIFDDCWNTTYTAGKQPDPKPGVHNSGWLQDPGDLLNQDTTLIVRLEAYVKDILTTFKNDKRIVLWDLYNEPGGYGHGSKSLPLLQKAFTWGRTVNPSQPLSAGYWSSNLKELNKFQLENSDVITYHTYENVASHLQLIELLRASAPGRPMICTEYMARNRNSTFQTIMPLLKDNNIGAINWGLVSGKTNTIFGWNKPEPDVAEPNVWFHDIFRKDGTPFSQEEIDFIRTVSAQDNKLTSAEKKAGWILLFNGENYDGWKNNNDKPVASAVENGAMQTNKCGGYILAYDKPFGDFILKCDVKMDSECNSGIFLRMSDLKDPVNTGFEIQIATENGSVHGHGALYDVRPALSNAGKGAGEWDHFEIKFAGPQLTVQLNGKQILDVNLDAYAQPGMRDIEGNHKFQLNGEPRALKDFARSGYIGFQDHDHKCWYKNIKLLPLKK